MANEKSCFWRAAYGLKMLIITLLVRRGSMQLAKSGKQQNHPEAEIQRERRFEQSCPRLSLRSFGFDPVQLLLLMTDNRTIKFGVNTILDLSTL